MPAFGGGPRRSIDLPGSLAEYVVVPAHSLVCTPKHLSEVEAATLSIAVSMSWRAKRTAALGPQKQLSCSPLEASRSLHCSLQRRTGRGS
jgi:NADPH:quinone reductase-like Zn-dependent oxidoreductase